MPNLQSVPGFVNRSIALALCCNLVSTSLGAFGNSAPTTTPIKHIVVIFQENRSFDQYFASYPFAANLPGENQFHAQPGTPTVNGLSTAGLLTSNPNSANPQRLSPANAIFAATRTTIPMNKMPSTAA
jgi:phospholipase C